MHIAFIEPYIPPKLILEERLKSDFPETPKPLNQGIYRKAIMGARTRLTIYSAMNIPKLQFEPEHDLGHIAN